MIDLHTHILPNIDDGAKDIDMAVEMVKVAEQDGIGTMVATPHLFRGHYNYDDLDVIERELDELREALKKEAVGVDVLAGAEVHISHNLMDEIRKHRKNLVIHDSSYMFVEFPPEHVFSGVKDLFFDLMSEGITPIIAHPERNSLFVRMPDLLFQLIRMGGLAQANQGSFTGLYGRNAQEAVFKFLEWDFLHFVASDCHNVKASAPRLFGAAQIIADVKGEETAVALVKDNPRAVIEDKVIPYCPDARDPRKSTKSLKIKMPSFFRKKRD